MKRRALGLLTLVLAGCVGPEKPDIVGQVEVFDVDSAAVGDSYRIFARLPPEYTDETFAARRFPLVLQLDANLETLEEFAVTAGFASRLEGQGDIGPVVVVGVGTPYDPQTPRRGRLRDFTIPLQHPDTNGGAATGGAAEFYAFLRDELLPQLDAKYRLAGPEHRALFGHSLGGLFSVYALSQADAARPLFRGYVAASPSLLYDGGTIYQYFDALLARAPQTEAVLFLAAGSLEGPEMIAYADDFADRVASRAPGIVLGNRRYSTDHLGSVAPSFEEGLLFMFQNGVGVMP